MSFLEKQNKTKNILLEDILFTHEKYQNFINKLYNGYINYVGPQGPQIVKTL